MNIRLCVMSGKRRDLYQVPEGPKPYILSYLIPPRLGGVLFRPPTNVACIAATRIRGWLST